LTAGGVAVFRPHADEQFYQRVALFVDPAANSSAIPPDRAPILLLRRFVPLCIDPLSRRVQCEFRPFHVPLLVEMSHGPGKVVRVEIGADSADLWQYPLPTAPRLNRTA
jgi:hypothetical protein